MVWKYDTGIDDLLVTHAVSLQLVYMICFKGSKHWGQGVKILTQFQIMEKIQPPLQSTKRQTLRESHDYFSKGFTKLFELLVSTCLWVCDS